MTRRTNFAIVQALSAAVVALLIACGAPSSGGSDAGTDVVDTQQDSGGTDVGELDVDDAGDTSDADMDATTDVVDDGDAGVDTEGDTQIDAVDVDPADATDTTDIMDTADSDVSDADVSDADDVLDAGDTPDVSDASDSGDANDAGDTSDVNDVGDVMDTDDVGDVADTDDVGDTTDVSDTGDVSDASDVDVTDDGGDTGVAMCDCGPCPGPSVFDDVSTELTPALFELALLDRIDDHDNLGYTPARDEMYSWLDVNPEGFIECIYTGTLVMEDGTRTPGGIFNTEHSWPQSLGADTEPMRSDVHHLFPTTERSNFARSNFLYGETNCDQSPSCGWYEAGSERGMNTMGETIFEVRPVSRGNVARAWFYFAVRYSEDIPPVTEEVLRRWHAEDPPDDAERLRNDGIESIQCNRNPFVDHPEFVELIPDY